MTAPIAVVGGRTLPRDHGGEVWRLELRHVPLIDGIIGYAVQSDLAVGPGLRPRSFDRVVEILRLARREYVEVAWRATRAARIDADYRIAPWYPNFRIYRLPG